jgi:hypothetical protein
MALPTRAELAAAYHKKHGALVEPRQGFSSLAPVLWLPYSMARKRNFTDLGTYVNKPLDHGGTDERRGPPAWAFDLGRKDGGFWSSLWGRRAAKAYVDFLVTNHRALAIEYVIYRDRIWSRKNGWRSYGPDTSHFWHIHVSGHWPGR